MDAPKPFFFVVFLLLVTNNASVGAQVEESAVKVVGERTEMPMGMSLYGGDFGDAEEEELEGEESAAAAAGSRRSLFWRTMRYYISYGALSANRIPCPPRSGRSYYTHNCHLATGPVRPYFRGCSAITRCRR
ncbi:PREDICTED: protein RALF-like 34 [Ipomoea nil]|uniref:protein RALF-like 34 n=1 Tax=Ipomoea nil TaxID=35883 RepID=UPI000900867D|nr:PREDICTED: protein RALF-like 34 [Ipomoea nil]